MSTLSLICLLPPGTAGLAERVVAAGGIPVLEVGDGGEGVVPDGAWVRVADADAAPGDGPVIVALGGAQRLAAGRPTWFESTSGLGLPSGAAGVVLLAPDAPAALAALEDTPRGTAVLLGGGLLPEDLSAAIAAGAHGVVLSDVLAALPGVAGADPQTIRGRAGWLARRAGSLVAVLWAFRGAMMGAGGGADGRQLALLQRIEAHLSASGLAPARGQASPQTPDVVVAGVSVGQPAVEGGDVPGAVQVALDTLRDAGVPLVVHEASESARTRSLPEGLCVGVGVVLLGEDTSLSAIAGALGASGPGQHLLPACANSAQALSLAVDWIQAGRADAVLVLLLQGTPSGLWLERGAAYNSRGGVPVARLRGSSVRMVGDDPVRADVIADCAAGGGMAPEALQGRSLDTGSVPVAAALRAVQDRGLPAGISTSALDPASTRQLTGGTLRFVTDVSLGSPVVAMIWERAADGELRVRDGAARAAWIREVTGLEIPVVSVEDGILTAVEGAVPAASPPSSPAATTAPPRSAPLDPEGPAALVADDLPPGEPAPEPSPELAPVPLLEPVGLAAAPTPSLGNSPRGLHPSVRLRRPRLVPEAAAGPSLALDGLTVMVLGDSGLAEAIREELGRRGAVLVEDAPAVVVDAEAAMATAQTCVAALGAPPRVWATLSRLGADPSWVDPDAAVVAGGRLGFARVLSRRWPLCRVQAIDLDPMLDDVDAANCAVEELASGAGATEVFHDGERRQVVCLQTERFPARAGLPGEAPVVVIAGSMAGPAGRVAMELARRGPTRFAVLDGLFGTDTGGHAAELDALRALGAEVRVLPPASGDEDGVAGALTEVRAAFGLISGAVACSGGANSGEAVDAVRALARHLDRVAWLLCLGSLRGRLGFDQDPERVIAEGAVSRLCLSRPRSVHFAWPAASLGSASPAAPTPVDDLAAAALAVDLVAGGVTGDVLATGLLRGLAPRAAHPLLETVDFDGDAVVARTSLLWRELDWARGEADMVVLPASMAVELLAATASHVQPGSDVLGASELRFPKPLAGRARLDLMVRAEPYDEGGIACVLSSQADDGTGETFAMGVVLLGDHAPLRPLPPTFFFSGEPVGAEALYAQLARSEPLQVLQEVGVIAGRGLVGTAKADHESLVEGLLIAPMVIEAALQACAVHAMAVDRTAGAPLRIDRVQLEQSPRDTEDLGVMVRREDGGYNVDVDGPRGAVLRLRGLRLGVGDRIDPSRGFQAPSGGWPEMVTGAVRVTGGAGAARSSDTIGESDGARGPGPDRPDGAVGGPG